MHGSRQPTPALSSQRIEGFDGIRGIATAMVVFYHLTVDFFPKPGFLPLPPDWTLVGAYVAVDLFFVLSGFLLTTLVLQSIERNNDRLDVREYYRRRVIRIVPGLVFFAVGHAIYAVLADMSLRNEAISLAMAFTGTINVPNLIDGFVLNDGVVHLWTLAIELQFYAVLPLLVLLLPPSRPKRALVVLGIAVIAVVVWRNHLASNDTLGAFLLIRTDTHGDSVLVGIALAYAWPYVRTVPHQVVAILGWVSLLGWIYMAVRFSLSDQFTYRAGFTIAAILSAVMITAIAQDAGPAALFRLRPFVLLGEVSFGFYMWHVMVFRGFVRWATDLPVAVQVGGALLTTAAFTAVSWYLIERPAMAYFTRRRRAAALKAAPAT